MASRLPSESARVGVVTVSYGSGDVLPGFLDSLTAASSVPLVVAIADNKATDADSVKTLAASRGVGYVAMPGNDGYGAAANAAITSLPRSVEWALIVNPDVVMSPGSIDALVARGETDARIAAVGPVTLTGDGQVYPSARAVPSLRTGVGHALFANLWLDNPWSRAYRDDAHAAPVLRDVGWLSGSCLLVRRSTFESVGGFDDGYFMYFEDVDLGYRLGKRGYRNVYEPDAVVTHTGAHSTTSESARMVAAHHESARRFLTRKYAGPLLWPIRIALTLGLRVRSAVIRQRLTNQ